MVVAGLSQHAAEVWCPGAPSAALGSAGVPVVAVVPVDVVAGLSQQAPEVCCPDAPVAALESVEVPVVAVAPAVVVAELLHVDVLSPHVSNVVPSFL